MTKFSIETFWANVKPRGRLAHVELGFAGGKRSLRSCEKIAEIAGLTDESVCPTLVREGLRFCGAGAFACQPIFSQPLTVAALISGPRRPRRAWFGRGSSPGRLVGSFRAGGPAPPTEARNRAERKKKTTRGRADLANRSAAGWERRRRATGRRRKTRSEESGGGKKG